MRKIDQLLGEYGESHQTKFNRIVHYFCVPAIFLSLIGLFAGIALPAAVQDILPESFRPFAHVGSVIIVLGLVYYLRLSVILFLSMLVFSTLVLLAIQQVVLLDIAPLWIVMLAIFVIAWIVQFIGHKHEGKKPSFLKDVQFLMIGPAWTMSHLFDALKIKF
ncbi:Mpo1 family 2-hydroxy fatty acid dioxygenase [Roseivirga misakiensis]|uniref:DUF962 domain-containing protein n=1 Tax=Roseivirga misakiensis TaxID=1563681 RepID=A0A1E5SZN2_9BACT|nr:Mpo1-like protein [Roseivirga misakiensis]OEK04582.1 hypothetical protein BFP71_14050 [Roseivirga misakiensis]